MLQNLSQVRAEQAEGLIVILTGSTGFTVMVTMFDVAGLPEAHNALDVNTQEIVLSFSGVNE